MTVRYLFFIFLLFLVFLCQGCVGQLFYHPDKVVYTTPAQHGLRFQDVTFQSGDGTKLTGWFIPAKGVAKGTVIHFHGNAQNMTAHFPFVSWLPAEGFNVFVFDYRGYGRSAGEPSREGLFQDSIAAVEYVASRSDVDPNRLLVLGQSLGGANAIAALGNNSFGYIRAVAIDSAFSSCREIVGDKIGNFPLISFLRTPLSYLLIGDSYSPQDAVVRISPIPLLIIHGTADYVVPLRHGQQLYEHAREPKQIWIIEGGSHTEAFAAASSVYRQRLVTFFNNSLESKTNQVGSYSSKNGGKK